MKWSFRIGRVSGIDIRVHVTFALIVAVFGMAFGRYGVFGAFYGVVLVCGLFLCVFLHELGHSLVAQAFGVPVREIMLLPIGGVARLGREPRAPLHELLIAVAGPAVNVAIAIVLFGVAAAAFGTGWLFDGGLFRAARPSWQGLVGYLLAGNVLVAVFNMIPALPMDGGRVFRAALSLVMSKRRATSIAATVGQLLAVGLIVLGVVGPKDPMWVAIGIFVFFAAGQERAASQSGAVLSNLRAHEAVGPNPIVLAPGDTLQAVLGHALRTQQSHFPVVHGEQMLGVLGRDEALRALDKLGPDAYVAGLIQRTVPEVDASMPLDEVRSRLIENEVGAVVVRGPHGYLGLLSLEDLSRAARVAERMLRSRRSAAGEAARSRAPLV